MIRHNHGRSNVHSRAVKVHLSTDTYSTGDEGFMSPPLPSCGTREASRISILQEHDKSMGTYLNPRDFKYLNVTLFPLDKEGYFLSP